MLIVIKTHYSKISPGHYGDLMHVVNLEAYFFLVLIGMKLIHQEHNNEKNVYFCGVAF